MHSRVPGRLATRDRAAPANSLRPARVLVSCRTSRDDSRWSLPARRLQVHATRVSAVRADCPGLPDGDLGPLQGDHPAWPDSEMFLAAGVLVDLSFPAATARLANLARGGSLVCQGSLRWWPYWPGPGLPAGRRQAAPAAVTQGDNSQGAIGRAGHISLPSTCCARGQHLDGKGAPISSCSARRSRSDGVEPNRSFWLSLTPARSCALVSNEIAELWRAWPGIPFQPGTGILGCGPGAGHAVPVEVPPDSGRIWILGPVELVGEEPVVPFAFRAARSTASWSTCRVRSTSTTRKRSSPT